VNVFFHNFNPTSNSGPNKFTRQLVRSLEEDKKISIVSSQEKSDLEFALIQLENYKKKPLILRLDGIYFNTRQDFNEQNGPIKYAYDQADCVVFQSNFNKELSEVWFGPHRKSVVIHNEPDLDYIEKVSDTKLDHIIDRSTEVWSCAASWRPHKRLEENLRYFCEKSPKNSVMFIAGSNPDPLTIKKYSSLSQGRIFYTGELPYEDLISLYKRSSTFIHLAYLDHCPNVVVDAQASGCKIICSSSGGTREIVKKGIVINDKDWDYNPIDLYSPPKLNFDNFEKVDEHFDEKKRNIRTAALNYYDAMKGIIDEKI
tara:strand:+ start:1136 stop:2077 length:942 start_codon:yes stop_codon:yes gene_type:complete